MPPSEDDHGVYVRGAKLIVWSSILILGALVSFLAYALLHGG
jgi:hypothetical protein